MARTAPAPAWATETGSKNDFFASEAGQLHDIATSKPEDADEYDADDVYFSVWSLYRMYRKDMITRERLSDCVSFTILVFVYLIVIFNQLGVNRFDVGQAMQDSFITREFGENGDLASISEIDEINQIYTYLEDVWLAAQYVEENRYRCSTYADDGVCDPLPAANKFNVNSFNKVVVEPTIRFYRSQWQECKPSYVSEGSNPFYALCREKNNNNPAPFRQATYLGGSVTGSPATSSGEYVFEDVDPNSPYRLQDCYLDGQGRNPRTKCVVIRFPMDPTKPSSEGGMEKASAMLKELKDFGIFDGLTHAMELTSVIYNVDLGIMGYSRLIIEQSKAGTLYSYPVGRLQQTYGSDDAYARGYSKLLAFRIDVYTTSGDYFRILFEVIAVCLGIYLFFRMVVKFRSVWRGDEELIAEWRRVAVEPHMVASKITKRLGRLRRTVAEFEKAAAASSNEDTVADHKATIQRLKEEIRKLVETHNGIRNGETQRLQGLAQEFGKARKPQRAASRVGLLDVETQQTTEGEEEHVIKRGARKVWKLFYRILKFFLGRDGLWNLVDLLISIGLLAAALFWLSIVSIIPDTPSSNGDVDSYGYNDFVSKTFQGPNGFQTNVADALQRTYSRYWSLNAYLIILMLFKLMSYLHASPYTNSLTMTVKKSMGALISFLLVFFFIVAGYALAGLYFYGYRFRFYRNFGNSVSTLLDQMFGGDGHREELFASASAGVGFTQVYYWSYTVIVALILVNMFVAILMAAFELQREEKAEHFFEAFGGQSLLMFLRPIFYRLGHHLGMCRRYPYEDEVLALLEVFFESLSVQQRRAFDVHASLPLEFYQKLFDVTPIDDDPSLVGKILRKFRKKEDQDNAYINVGVSSQFIDDLATREVSNAKSNTGFDSKYLIRYEILKEGGVAKLFDTWCPNDKGIRTGRGFTLNDRAMRFHKNYASFGPRFIVESEHERLRQGRQSRKETYETETTFADVQELLGPMSRRHGVTMKDIVRDAQKAKKEHQQWASKVNPSKASTPEKRPKPSTTGRGRLATLAEDVILANAKQGEEASAKRERPAVPTRTSSRGPEGPEAPGHLSRSTSLVSLVSLDGKIEENA